MSERDFQDVRRDFNDVLCILRSSTLDPNVRAKLLCELGELFVEADRLSPESSHF